MYVSTAAIDASTGVVSARESRRSAVFVMPSADEAFGVAYIEAMAGGLVAIGAQGEPGPREIAATGEGLLTVPLGDPQALAVQLAALAADREALAALGAGARATVARSFTWEQCGRATVAAYAEALAS